MAKAPPFKPGNKGSFPPKKTAPPFKKAAAPPPDSEDSPADTAYDQKMGISEDSPQDIGMGGGRAPPKGGGFPPMPVQQVPRSASQGPPMPPKRRFP